MKNYGITLTRGNYVFSGRQKAFDDVIFGHFWVKKIRLEIFQNRFISRGRLKIDLLFKTFNEFFKP